MQLSAGHAPTGAAQLQSIAVPIGAPLDVRLACALLIYAASDVEGQHPIQLSFTNYEDDYDLIQEISALAGWAPTNWNYQRKKLSEMASHLESYGYFTARLHYRNEDAMENNEPVRWKIYCSPLKYRARLNPTFWKGYNPEWPPVQELAYVLSRVFDYEDEVSDWRSTATING